MSRLNFALSGAVKPVYDEQLFRSIPRQISMRDDLSLPAQHRFGDLPALRIR